MHHFDKRQARRVRLQENTSYYIATYLNPNRKWNRIDSAKQRINLIRCADVDWVAISHHIKAMNYREFLATPYWKAVAAHTRYLAGYRCQLCNNNANLSTHHRDYRIHGREHACMNELIVLCYSCHQKFHSPQEKIVQSIPDTIEPTNRIDVIDCCIFVIGVFAIGFFLSWLRG